MTDARLPRIPTVFFFIEDQEIAGSTNPKLGSSTSPELGDGLYETINASCVMMHHDASNQLVPLKL